MKKILLVDDDPNILKYYKEELLDEGYDVHTAGSGKAAQHDLLQSSLELNDAAHLLGFGKPVTIWGVRVGALARPVEAG